MRFDQAFWSWVAGLTVGLLALPAHAGTMIDLLNLSFAGNPLLQSQAQLVQASQAEIKGANWQFFPTPSVSVEQVNASQQDTSYNSKDGRVITFRLQQPLWTGGRLTAGVARAEAAAVVAQAQMEETRQQLALRTIQVWGEWNAGQQKSLALQDSVQTHQRLSALIRRRVEGGVSAVADDVLAQGRLEQTQGDATSAQAQLASALARLEQLTGKRLSPDEMARWLERFLKEDGINIVGGCCGSNEDHIAAVNAMLERQVGGKRRPAKGIARPTCCTQQSALARLTRAHSWPPAPG
jgi:adhesin transport system outer membrane protein